MTNLQHREQALSELNNVKRLALAAAFRLDALASPDPVVDYAIAMLTVNVGNALTHAITTAQAASDDGTEAPFTAQPFAPVVQTIEVIQHDDPRYRP